MRSAAGRSGRDSSPSILAICPLPAFRQTSPISRSVASLFHMRAFSRMLGEPARIHGGSGLIREAASCGG